MVRTDNKMTCREPTAVASGVAVAARAEGISAASLPADVKSSIDPEEGWAAQGISTGLPKECRWKFALAAQPDVGV